MIYKSTKIEQFKRNNRWLGSALLITKYLIIALTIISAINWFFNKYMLVFNMPVQIVDRASEYQHEIDFYEQYGPYLDENYQKPEVIQTPTPTPTPKAGLELEPLQSFNAPDEIKELVMLFSERANVPPAFAMGILLTENRSFNYSAVNTNYDGSQDHGLWQLNNIPEYDPVKNTERAADILNSKRAQLIGMGVQEPSLGLLAESYNKGAAGALSLLYDPAGYARLVLNNAVIPHLDDPFASDPFAFVNKL